MKKTFTDLSVIQNLGWLDRVVRTTLGFALLGYATYQLFMGDIMQPPWTVYAILVSIYPIISGIIGYDALYDYFSVRSCGLSDRNQCGTFPYEVDAALGHHPIPDSDVDHSLEHSHH